MHTFARFLLPSGCKHLLQLKCSCMMLHYKLHRTGASWLERAWWVYTTLFHHCTVSASYAQHSHLQPSNCMALFHHGCRLHATHTHTQEKLLSCSFCAFYCASHCNKFASKLGPRRIMNHHGALCSFPVSPSREHQPLQERLPVLHSTHETPAKHHMMPRSLAQRMMAAFQLGRETALSRRPLQSILRSPRCAKLPTRETVACRWC
jgi:hypothetical protein